MSPRPSSRVAPVSQVGCPRPATPWGLRPRPGSLSRQDVRPRGGVRAVVDVDLVLGVEADAEVSADADAIPFSSALWPALGVESIDQAVPFQCSVSGRRWW